MSEHVENMEEILAENKTSVNESAESGLSEDSGGQSSFVEKEVETQQEPQERAGDILKREREAQGLSLDIVHESTKIPLDALRAIEEGYTVRTLSPFYYTGFLKMYANYLGVDASKVIEDYKEEELPQHIERNVEDFQPPQWITNFLTKKRKRQMVIAAGVILAIFLFFKMIGFFMHLGARSADKKDSIKTEAAKKASQSVAVKKERKEIVEDKQIQERKEAGVTVSEAIKEVEPKSQPVPESQPTAVVPVAIVDKNIILTVRARQNSWLRVSADETIVFQSTLRTGAVETWAADDQIEISGKNINQLEFELNGKIIGTLGRKDRNAKKVIITKNGLSVKN